MFLQKFFEVKSGCIQHRGAALWHYVGSMRPPWMFGIGAGREGGGRRGDRPRQRYPQQGMRPHSPARLKVATA